MSASWREDEIFRDKFYSARGCPNEMKLGIIAVIPSSRPYYYLINGRMNLSISSSSAGTFTLS